MGVEGGFTVASSISWLDTSSTEQRRMREILGLFTEKESREELGLGQIRDAVADGLFPGTSTLHTRARYLLFIPWIYQEISARGGNFAQARNQELALIKALRSNGRNDRGIIGSEAGSTLKTVPSALYWSALGTFGILTDRRLGREEALALEGASNLTMNSEGNEPHLRAWRASLPKPPGDFPQEVPAGMALGRDEAAWLQERIIDSTSGTLFAHLALHPPEVGSSVPWEDPVAQSVTGAASHLLDHSHRFAETVQGAQLLYNLLIAESYEADGLTRLAGRRDDFTTRLHEWAERCGDGEAWRSWDLDDFFARVTAVRGTRVARGSEVFVRRWASLLCGIDVHSLAENHEARDLVRRRERQNKGVMARIGNSKRLETWGGSSGAGRYSYRWSHVQTILHDIHAGLNAPGPVHRDEVHSDTRVTVHA